MKDKSFSIAFSLLVYFHSFLMSMWFPFVVCWLVCLFDVCSRVVVSFCDFHVCLVSFCDVYLSRWHVLSPLCALPLFVGETPKSKKTNENEKTNRFQLLFPFWCVLMPFWCVFALLCVDSCVFSLALPRCVAPRFHLVAPRVSFPQGKRWNKKTLPQSEKKRKANHLTMNCLWFTL